VELLGAEHWSGSVRVVLPTFTFVWTQDPVDLHCRGARRRVTSANLATFEPEETIEAPGRQTGTRALALLVSPAALARALGGKLPTALPLGQSAIQMSAAIHDDPALVAAFHHLCTLLQDPGGRPEVRARAFATFARLLAVNVVVVPVASPELTGRPCQAAIRRARAFIDDRYAEPITLDQIAAEAGRSKFHLSRIFAEAIGMPPHAYLRQVRVWRATELLRLGALAQEAADRTGFSDQAHMTHTFRDVIGLPPSVFRTPIRSRRARVPLAA
jgi:AraC-like DNA-binding protein